MNNNINKNISDTNKELQNIENSIKKINSSFESSLFFNDSANNLALAEKL